MRLFTDLGAGKPVDQPANTVARYITATPGHTQLTVTSPDDRSSVTGSVTVAGTTAAGNLVDVLATNADTSFVTTSASLVAQPDGSFAITMPVGAGTTVLNIVATSATGATAHATRTVVYDFVAGTKLFDATDPGHDDFGPGNYAYPTSADFKPGAYDLQDFQVYDDGTDITFRAQTSDLSPTFGSPLGAQLVDVYVHDPSAAAGDLDRPRRSRNATTRSGRRAPGTGSSRSRVRPAVPRCAREHARDGVDPRQRGLAVHHVQRPEGHAGPARCRLGLHRGPHGPGRLQLGPGTGLRADAAAVPVRRVRRHQQRSALHLQPQLRAQGDRRDRPCGGHPVDRARLHAGTGRAPAGGHSLTAIRACRWCVADGASLAEGTDSRASATERGREGGGRYRHRRMFVKICGITNEDDALLAVAMGADAVGFVFAPSPRQIAAQQVYDITRRLPPEILTVGVFRDELPERVVEIVHRAGLKAAQLHGHETPADGRPRSPAQVRWVIKAFAAGSPDAAPGRRATAPTSILVDAPDARLGQGVRLGAGRRGARAVRG